MPVFLFSTEQPKVWGSLHSTFGPRRYDFTSVGDCYCRSQRSCGGRCRDPATACTICGARAQRLQPSLTTGQFHGTLQRPHDPNLHATKYIDYISFSVLCVNSRTQHLSCCGRPTGFCWVTDCKCNSAVCPSCCQLQPRHIAKGHIMVQAGLHRVIDEQHKFVDAEI